MQNHKYAHTHAVYDISLLRGEGFGEGRLEIKYAVEGGL